MRGITRWRCRLACGAALVAAMLAPAHAQDIGKRLALCAACHGADGNASLPNAPSLAGQPRVFIENQLVMIREGLRDIPAMKGMLAGVTDEEIGALAGHYSALPVKPVPAARDSAMFARGEALARDSRCGSCHLPTYLGREQMPRLAGQREDYLLHSMRQFKSNQAVGRDTIMAASLYGMSDADLQAMAHYLARVQP